MAQADFLERRKRGVPVVCDGCAFSMLDLVLGNRGSQVDTELQNPLGGLGPRILSHPDLPDRAAVRTEQGGGKLCLVP